MLDAPAYPAIRELGADLGVPARWVLSVFYLESRFMPGICNELGYCGLSQIASSTLRAQFRVEPSEYKLWPASRQVRDVIAPWYTEVVRDYLKKAPRSPGVLYALNLAPGVVAKSGDGADVVLYAAPDNRYEQNKGLDVDKDGRITIADLDAYIAKLVLEPQFQTAAKTLDGGDAPAPPSRGGGGGNTGRGGGGPFFLAIGGALLIFAARKRRRAA